MNPGTLITLHVNGEKHLIGITPNRTLQQVLRQNLNLTGTKDGCGVGDCGACTVIVNGQTVNSCLLLAVEADGAEITTIEGLSHNGELSPLQKSFVKNGALQCGFCTSGMILAATALINQNPNPSKDEILAALDGNLCRCGTYPQHPKAILAAAKKQ